MQKQTIKIEFLLALQSTDTEVQLGVFNKRLCLSSSILNKKDASKNFLIVLDELLNKAKIPCKSISACIVNRGPSPFTLLRTVITYAHGLQAALKIPLAGIEGFYALAAEHEKAKYDTLILQNAFGNQLYYYYVKNTTKEIKSGCVYYQQLKETLNLPPESQIMLLGNGYEQYTSQLSYLNEIYIIKNDQTAYFPSINFLGSWGYDQIINGSIALTNQTIMPLYLKNPDFFSK